MTISSIMRQKVAAKPAALHLCLRAERWRLMRKGKLTVAVMVTTDIMVSLRDCLQCNYIFLSFRASRSHLNFYISYNNVF